jgi:hypothetical protein
MTRNEQKLVNIVKSLAGFAKEYADPSAMRAGGRELIGRSLRVVREIESGAMFYPFFHQDCKIENVADTLIRAEGNRNPSFDTALPQAWVDAMREIGYNPLGSFVWEYTGEGYGGRPRPLVFAAKLALEKYNQKYNTFYFTGFETFALLFPFYGLYDDLGGMWMVYQTSTGDPVVSSQTRAFVIEWAIDNLYDPAVEG